MKRREFLKVLGVAPAVPLVIKLSEDKPLHSGLVHLKTEGQSQIGPEMTATEVQARIRKYLESHRVKTPDQWVQEINELGIYQGW